MSSLPSVYAQRELQSKTRFNQLRSRIAKLPGIQDFHGLTIFGAGSYARNEASEYSDIDMFFLCERPLLEIPEPHTKQLRLFGKLIEDVEELGFPKFSNDGQYLTIMETEKMLSHLGSPDDDHLNYFTMRMLLLLESKCLYGDDVYRAVIKRIVHSYFEDYPDHQKSFEPNFLLNDICRFWKTLLLNYEHKRRPVAGWERETTEEEKEKRRVKQKVRNFKLKFSRMTTCFATISALGSYDAPVKELEVIEQILLTPRERLQQIPSRLPIATDIVEEILLSYAWFLDQTGVPEDVLFDNVKDVQVRTEMFRKASEYGDLLFKLLKLIDEERKENSRGLLRFLVI